MEFQRQTDLLPTLPSELNDRLNLRCSLHTCTMEKQTESTGECSVSHENMYSYVVVFPGLEQCFCRQQGGRGRREEGGNATPWCK